MHKGALLEKSITFLISQADVHPTKEELNIYKHIYTTYPQRFMTTLSQRYGNVAVS